MNTDTYPKCRTCRHSCPYCASLVTGNRCESCGAPRMADDLHKEIFRQWMDLASYKSELAHPELR